jgi:signal transduction histidine kinase
VSLASHQLRTPITAVNWYTEMLLGGDVGPLTTQQEKYLREIKHGNARMIELVNTLLSVSRIELGTLVMQTEPIDLAEVADDVLKELDIQIAEKKLSVTRNYAPELPAIVSDDKLVRIVFQNLLTNALTYTAPGGRIALSLTKTGSQSAKIEIADNGYGIPENVQSKIYTKFFRADNAKAREPDGTGLGLYITKSIVESLGGTISFTSHLGEGTTFTVTLASIEPTKQKS